MELQEFVDSTITQIINGIKSAQEKNKNTGARINPPSPPKGFTNKILQNNLLVSGDKIHTSVDFDVAIIGSEDKTGKGKAGLLVASIGLGGEFKYDKSNSIINRVKFSVLLELP